MGKHAGYLYVCNFGVVNCRLCKTADQTAKREERAKELKTQRAEAFRFRNSPRLVMVTPKTPTPSAPAPALYRTITQAMIEDSLEYESRYLLEDMLYGNSGARIETAKHSKDITPTDVILQASENEWRERTWGKRSN